MNLIRPHRRKRCVLRNMIMMHGWHIKPRNRWRNIWRHKYEIGLSSE
ncbi:unnamed protein product [Brassica napus]|uniref:(rape) hypothetical protein n=1 Tax=Brassica napus TaxID=3708 RepID=A0A816KTR2_BRANA|nr:unnamed protein product [Brassica napus]